MRGAPPILALIPARGGSKGLRRKNLAPLGGLPLLAHTLLQARRAQRVGRVVVSTEDAEIAAVARHWGADVVERPAELASDEATSESALAHALDTLAAGGYEPELVVFLQCTSPLRTPDEVDRAVDTLEREGADSLLSVVPLDGFVWSRQDGELAPSTYDPSRRPRRQEIGRQLIENGSIYVFRPAVLRSTGNRLGGEVVEYPMHPLSLFQIDEPGDLELVESLLPLHPWRPTPEGLDRIGLLVLDFDGVLTDDRVWVDQHGVESVACSRADGLGIERLRAAGIEVVVLSKESNPVVAERCAKLGIECEQGHDEKLAVLERMADERDLDAARIAYVGNDLNDLECLRWAGLGFAVSTARHELLAAADWITAAPGGRGAVREVCELLLAAQPASRTADSR